MNTSYGKIILIVAGKLQKVVLIRLTLSRAALVFCSRADKQKDEKLLDPLNQEELINSSIESMNKVSEQKYLNFNFETRIHNCRVMQALTILRPLVSCPCNMCETANDLLKAIKQITALIKYYKVGKCVSFNPFVKRANMQ